MGALFSRCLQWCADRPKSNTSGGRQSSRTDLLRQSSSSSKPPSAAGNRRSARQLLMPCLSEDRISDSEGASRGSGSNLSQKRLLFASSNSRSTDSRRSSQRSFYSSNGETTLNFGHQQQQQQQQQTAASIHRSSAPQSPMAASGPSSRIHSPSGATDCTSKMFARSFGHGSPSSTSSPSAESRRAAWLSQGGALSVDSSSFLFGGGRASPACGRLAAPHEHGGPSNEGIAPAALRMTLSQRVSAAAHSSGSSTPPHGSRSRGPAGVSTDAGNLSQHGARRSRLHNIRNDF